MLCKVFSICPFVICVSAFGCLMSGLGSECVIRIGKWSDDRSCVADEVWLVLVSNGFLAGESVLFRMLRRGSRFSMASPHTSEYCVVSQAVS